MWSLKCLQEADKSATQFQSATVWCLQEPDADEMPRRQSHYGGGQRLIRATSLQPRASEGGELRPRLSRLSTLQPRSSGGTLNGGERLQLPRLSVRGELEVIESGATLCGGEPLKLPRMSKDG